MNEQSHIQALSNRVYRQRADGARREPTVGDGAPRTQRVVGHYRLSTRIGRGRLGEIYEAFDEASGELGVERRVAIQLLDPRIVAQDGVFDELRRAYAALRAGPHMNIVDILDFGRDGDTTFLVMKLLEGASLRFVLDDAVTLSVDETCAVVRAVGDALQYLHAKGLVYGELRPENVLITFDYQVKLLDVAPAGMPSAVSYYVEDGDTREPTRDMRDDVYSLACLTYELLSGKHPFNSNSPREAQRAGLRPTPINGLAPGQWRAIASGLALQRGLRTSTVAEFLYELGVQGTERLRVPEQQVLSPEPPAPVHAPAYEPSSYAAQEEVVSPPPPPRSFARAGQDFRYARAEIDRGDPPTRMFSRFLLLVVVAGIAALLFLYYEPLRERGAELIAANDAAPQREDSSATSDSPFAEPPSEVRPGIDTVEELDSPSRAGVAGVPVESSIASADSAAEPQTLAADAPAAAAEDQPVAQAAEAPNASAGGSTSAPVEAPATAGLSEPQAQTASRAAVETPPATPAETPRTEPPASAGDSAQGVQSDAPAGPAFSAPAVVAVAENDAAAVVVVMRSNPAAAASVVWWTSPESALADEDYADLGERREEFAAGEETRSLYVPLISDSVPERNESFYVYVGRYDSRQRSLEPYSSTRVDIADDD